MNWKRGFFRLWVVFAVLWVIGVVVVAFGESSIPSLTRSCDLLPQFTESGTGRQLTQADVDACEVVWKKKRLELVGWAAGPPAAVLLLGLVMMWVFRGFRHSR